MKKYDIYAIGNAIVDKEFEVTDDIFEQQNIEKGMMTLVEKDHQQILLQELKGRFGLKKRASGGSAANSIIATQYFGGQVFLSCKTADDEPGEFYNKDLIAAGVDTNTNDNSGTDTDSTGKCIVMVSPDAERTMCTHLGVAGDLGPEDLNPEALRNSGYLYIEGYLITSPKARDAVLQARNIAKENNIKTALTFSDPSMVEFFGNDMKLFVGEGVDILFCNQEEACLWTGETDVKIAAEKLKDSANQFAITLGANGALLYDGIEFINVAPFPAKAIDTNGAGDMFAGAFMYAITHGHSFSEAGKLACRASSEVVCSFGPRLEPEKHAIIRKEILGS